MISVIFGNIGCGKSTQAIKLAKLGLKSKEYSHVYINFEHNLPEAEICNLDKLGEWTPAPNSLLIIDEAGIEYNSRAYKSLPKDAIRWFKKSRHYGVDIVIFSQSFEDMDITLRRLATEYWYLKKVGVFTLQRRMYKTFTVDKTTGQPIDFYRLANKLWLLVFPIQFLTRNYRWKLTFRPFYYRFFDSWLMDDIPVKHFEKGRPPAKTRFRQWFTKIKKFFLKIFKKNT